mmetsp:Transcript_78941/g.226223  ORF Transcript_78941/g.226223 Transcript_78941/m.226223 type:complete len:93 (-) Transcript_78941:575-853(-)
MVKTVAPGVRVQHTTRADESATHAAIKSDFAAVGTWQDDRNRNQRANPTSTEPQQGSKHTRAAMQPAPCTKAFMRYGRVENVRREAFAATLL